MPGESGYFYLNAGNAWPPATLGPTLQQSGGLIGLKKTGSTFATTGSFIAGPFQVSDRPTSWFRMLATLKQPLAGSHVQFFTFVAPGGPAPWNPASLTPFSDPRWKAAPRDALDFAIVNAPDLALFVGGF